KSGYGITIDEESVPIREAVSGVAELIGISPYEVANEGKAIITVKKESAADLVNALRTNPLGKNAAIIGEVNENRPGKVVMRTEVGGRRFLEAPLGDPVPRIC
ncbi:hydrogenase expression/formation protein HypE, partial [Candidatus Bipolaricaulota bacterium]|nr:hydrogenase expression/formation protein HypE [Candidatus Bipolaricaulota bacterium]